MNRIFSSDRAFIVVIATFWLILLIVVAGCVLSLQNTRDHSSCIRDGTSYTEYAAVPFYICATFTPYRR